MPVQPQVSHYQDPFGNILTNAIPGTPIAIIGTNFGTTGTVNFSGIPAVTTSWTNIAIVAIVPTAVSYPVVGPVTVIVQGDGTGDGPGFSIASPPLPHFADKKNQLATNMTVMVEQLLIQMKNWHAMREYYNSNLFYMTGGSAIVQLDLIDGNIHLTPQLISDLIQGLDPLFEAFPQYIKDSLRRSSRNPNI